MLDFKKITKILEKMGEERFIIVEKGEPRWVVLSMADYEKLKKSQDAIAKLDEELPSFQEEEEQEEEGWPSLETEETEEEKEPELYFESLEDEEEDADDFQDLPRAEGKANRGGWNDIPF
ncbi:MAG: hypothetical protein Q8N68_03465 [bacterium]|nr:hypothetical protein [bacterium]